MKRVFKYIMLLLTISLLSGCLYPKEKLKQNQIPYEVQISTVQSAVEQYKEVNGGLLPIKTRDMSTPIYQKYPIEFGKLIPKYIGEAPGSAYENGGDFLYVLVNVETNPSVKLLDLKVTEKISDLHLRLDVYRQQNGYPPVKDVINKDYFTLDYEKLGLKEEPYVVSPYTGNNLPFFIDSDANIYVDYRIDLAKALSENTHSFKKGDDIREILVVHSNFVPAHSVPYTIDPEKNEPIFLSK